MGKSGAAAGNLLLTAGSLRKNESVLEVLPLVKLGRVERDLAFRGFEDPRPVPGIGVPGTDQRHHRSAGDGVKMVIS